MQRIKCEVWEGNLGSTDIGLGRHSWAGTHFLEQVVALSRQSGREASSTQWKKVASPSLEAGSTCYAHDQQQQHLLNSGSRGIVAAVLLLVGFPLVGHEGKTWAFIVLIQQQDFSHLPLFFFWIIYVLSMTIKDTFGGACFRA